MARSIGNDGQEEFKSCRTCVHDKPLHHVKQLPEACKGCIVDNEYRNYESKGAQMKYHCDEKESRTLWWLVWVLTLVGALVAECSH